MDILIGEAKTYGGGGYFAGGDGIDLNNVDRSLVALGGISNQGSQSTTHASGSGGTAGTGGVIRVSSAATIYAYNGNLYTDGTDYQDGLNQCPIYLQFGVVTSKYSYTYTNITVKNTSFFELVLESGQTVATTTGYSNTAYDSISNDYRYITKNSVLTNVDMSTQGIGSGAGYIEVSNGTYTVDSSMN